LTVVSRRLPKTGGKKEEGKRTKIAWGSHSTEKPLPLRKDGRQPKIGDQNVRIWLFGGQKKILWLQVTVNNTLRVQMLNSQHDFLDNLRSVLL
jgi:hypothetical protein